jgi:predicted dehydrogenase
MSKQRSIQFIGAGFISRFSHAGNLTLLPDFDSIHIAVADPNPAALEEFLKVVPQAEVFGDYNQMLASGPARETDFVVISTPPFLHRSMTVDALKSGRHVLCEKPLGIHLEEGREMLAAAKSAGRLLGCCSSRVAGAPATAMVKEMVDSGRLGDVYHASLVFRQARHRTGIEYQPTSRFFLDKSKNGGGPVFDWGPYDLNSIVDALDPEKIEVLHAWTARPETEIDPRDFVFDVEEHAGATMRFHRKDGNSVVVDYERAFCMHGDEANGYPHTSLIEGTRGGVRWQWITEGPGKIRHWGDQAGKSVSEELVSSPEGDVPLHARPIVFFDRAVRGEPSPAYLNEDALFRFEILCAIYRCAETGKPQILNRPQ